MGNKLLNLFYVTSLLIIAILLILLRYFEIGIIIIIGVINFEFLYLKRRKRSNESIRNECEALFLSKQYERLIELTSKLELDVIEREQRATILISKCYAHLVLDEMDEVEDLLIRFENKKRYIVAYNHISLLINLDNGDIEKATSNYHNLEVYKLTLEKPDKDTLNSINQTRHLLDVVLGKELVEISRLQDSVMPIILRIISKVENQYEDTTN